ncbi:MAG: hypothetical protein LBC35_02485, partial [Coriobacteriales bacterium]|nr:hypothetical protein [Coriobacteriales bacterium]
NAGLSAGALIPFVGDVAGGGVFIGKIVGKGVKTVKAADTVTGVVRATDLPTNAKKAYEAYDAHGWRGNVSGQTPGTRAGGGWNDSKNQLPSTDATGNPITYKEFDVNDYVPGAERDKERFLRGSDGSVYYTSDHYASFVKID